MLLQYVHCLLVVNLLIYPKTHAHMTTIMINKDEYTHTHTRRPIYVDLRHVFLPISFFSVSISSARGKERLRFCRRKDIYIYEWHTCANRMCTCMCVCVWKEHTSRQWIAKCNTKLTIEWRSMKTIFRPTENDYRNEFIVGRCRHRSDSRFTNDHSQAKGI